MYVLDVKLYLLSLAFPLSLIIRNALFVSDGIIKIFIIIKIKIENKV